MYKCTTHFAIEIAVAFNRLVIVFPSTRIYPPPPSFLRRSVCSLALSFAFSSFSPCFPSLFADDTLAPSSPLPSLARRIEQAEINVCVFVVFARLAFPAPLRYDASESNTVTTASCWLLIFLSFSLPPSLLLFLLPSVCLSPTPSPVNLDFVRIWSRVIVVYV